jgi:trehalose-phosphatase
MCTSDLVKERISRAERLWLFLDYDGTLADFAPTPEHIYPDEALIDLLARLSQHPRIRITVVSGRRLDHVAALVPLSGVLLAGTYGVELQTPRGERIHRVAYNAVRPTLDVLKQDWQRLIAQREGFFLEDKGWALALHARYAATQEAQAVLAEARAKADEMASLGSLRVLGGHRFLELGPRLAHKGQTVAYLLKRYPWVGALPLYLGDDDKDEEAFGLIKARDGISILVSPQPRQTQADCRLPSPQAARQWLAKLLTCSDR